MIPATAQLCPVIFAPNLPSRSEAPEPLRTIAAELVIQHTSCRTVTLI